MTHRHVLVTGASGFIGSFLVRRLLDEGYHVHLVLRDQSNFDLIDNSGNSVHFYRHDGSTAGLVNIVKSAAPLVVFHLASLFLAHHTSNDVERLVQSNLLFSTQLVEAMHVNGVKMLVNTGTSWQHFDNADYNPVCLYAALKEAFEVVLRFYAEIGDMRIITLKLFDTYGPNDNRPKLLNLLKNASISGDKLAMSPGDQLIDLVYIDDVIDAFMVAFDRLQSGHMTMTEKYAVASGTPLSLKEVAKIYTKVSGRTLNIDWGGRAYRPREVMVPWTNYKMLPGWSPKIDFTTGIRRIIANDIS